MRALTRPILAAFLTVLAAVTPVVSPAHAARAAGSPAWKPCAEDKTAGCATIRVPIDWARPHGATVAIALARRPATDPKARIGTLIVNPGGPGGSGVDFAMDSPYFFSKAVRKHFDIVGYDPRGVSRSHAVVCSVKLLNASPPITITDQKQYNAVVAYNRRLAADCAKRTGPLFGHVDTLSVARDMDALRAALGEQKISFYGASYGTLLGQQYAELYPQRLRALVLDSVMDHSGDITSFLGGETNTAQDSFRQFVAWCGRSTECALHGRDVRKLWAGLLASARRGMLRDPFEPTRRLGEYDLLDAAFGSFYDPQWHALAIFIEEATGGPAGRKAKPTLDVLEHSFPAVFCDDWALPVAGYPDLRARLARLARDNPQMPYSPLGLSSLVGCLGWPLPASNPQRPLKPARTGSILLINARHDPATSYGWARNVAARLGPAASLFTYDGWGHTVYGRSTCVNTVVDRYLIALRRPVAGASCPGVLPEPSGVGGGIGRAGYR